MLMKVLITGGIVIGALMAMRVFGRAADTKMTREEEQALNQKNLKRANPEKQLQIALEAFEGNGYFVLINDRQAESLDDEVVVTADATISFVKLTPLVGG